MTSDQAIGISSLLVSVIAALFTLLLGHRSKTVTALEKLQHEITALQSKLELCEHERRIATEDKLAMYQKLLDAEAPAPRKKPPHG